MCTRWSGCCVYMRAHTHMQIQAVSKYICYGEFYIFFWVKCKILPLEDLKVNMCLNMTRIGSNLLVTITLFNLKHLPRSVIKVNKQQYNKTGSTRDMSFPALHCSCYCYVSALEHSCSWHFTTISSYLNPWDANVSIISGVVCSLKALEERGRCEKYASQIYTCSVEAEGRRTAFLCRMHTLPNHIYSRNDYVFWTLSLSDFYKHTFACVAIAHPSKY